MSVSAIYYFVVVLVDFIVTSCFAILGLFLLGGHFPNSSVVIIKYSIASYADSYYDSGLCRKLLNVL